jgi:hypothetical protein
MMDNKTDDTSVVPVPVEKKSYSAPVLIVYGDLRTITENRMRTGVDNGGAGSNFSQ